MAGKGTRELCDVYPDLSEVYATLQLVFTLKRVKAALPYTHLFLLRKCSEKKQKYI